MFANVIGAVNPIGDPYISFTVEYKWRAQGDVDYKDPFHAVQTENVGGKKSFGQGTQRKGDRRADENKGKKHEEKEILHHERR